MTTASSKVCRIDSINIDRSHTSSLTISKMNVKYGYASEHNSPFNFHRFFLSLQSLDAMRFRHRNFSFISIMEIKCTYSLVYSQTTNWFIFVSTFFVIFFCQPFNSINCVYVCGRLIIVNWYVNVENNVSSKNYLVFE